MFFLIQDADQCNQWFAGYPNIGSCYFFRIDMKEEGSNLKEEVEGRGFKDDGR